MRAMWTVFVGSALCLAACSASSEDATTTEPSTGESSEALVASDALSCGPPAPGSVVPSACVGQIVGDGTTCRPLDDLRKVATAACGTTKIPTVGSLQFAAYCTPSTAKMAFVACCTSTGTPFPGGDDAGTKPPPAVDAGGKPAADAAPPPPPPPSPACTWVGIGDGSCMSTDKVKSLAVAACGKRALTSLVPGDTCTGGLKNAKAECCDSQPAPTPPPPPPAPKNCVTKSLTACLTIDALKRESVTACGKQVLTSMVPGEACKGGFANSKIQCCDP